MSEQEFKSFLDKNTSIDLVFNNAERIYDYLSELFESECYDSTMREWAFQWYAQNNQSYSDAYEAIYTAWRDS